MKQLRQFLIVFAAISVVCPAVTQTQTGFHPHVVFDESADMRIGVDNPIHLPRANNATFLPDGKKELLLVSSGGTNKFFVVDRNPETGDLSNPEPAPDNLQQYAWIYTPSVSLDGTRLAGIARFKGQKALIVLTREDTDPELGFKNPRILLDQSMALPEQPKKYAHLWYFESDVSFSPKADRIIFLLNIGGADGSPMGVSSVYQVQWDEKTQGYGTPSIYIRSDLINGFRPYQTENVSVYFRPFHTPKISPDGQELTFKNNFPISRSRRVNKIASVNYTSRTVMAKTGIVVWANGRCLICNPPDEDPVVFAGSPSVSPDGKFYQAPIETGLHTYTIITWPRKLEHDASANENVP